MRNHPPWSASAVCAGSRKYSAMRFGEETRISPGRSVRNVVTSFVDDAEADARERRTGGARSRRRTARSQRDDAGVRRAEALGDLLDLEALHQPVADRRGAEPEDRAQRIPALELVRLAREQDREDRAEREEHGRFRLVDERPELRGAKRRGERDGRAGRKPRRRRAPGVSVEERRDEEDHVVRRDPELARRSRARSRPSRRGSTARLSARRSCPRCRAASRRRRRRARSRAPSREPPRSRRGDRSRRARRRRPRASASGPPRARRCSTAFASTTTSAGSA